MARYEVKVYRCLHGDDWNEEEDLIARLNLESDEVLVHKESVSFQSKGNSYEINAYGKESINHVLTKGNQVAIYINVGKPNE